MEARKTLKAGDDVEFDEVVADTGAGAKFEPVTDFLAEGVKGVGGAQAMAAALRIFAACGVAAVGARFYCGFKLHAAVMLSLDIDVVNDADDD
jgi:hypothetical protein